METVEFAIVKWQILPKDQRTEADIAISRVSRDHTLGPNGYGRGRPLAVVPCLT